MPWPVEISAGGGVGIDPVAQIYEAFGRGEVAAILGGITDDVDWAAETTSAGAPWYGVRHGKDAVAGFFAAFGSAMEVEVWALT